MHSPLADTVFSSLQGGLYDILQNVEKEYKQKIEAQQNQIEILQERVNELEQYDRIDDILDEIDSTLEDDGKVEREMTQPPQQVNEEEDDDDDDNTKKTPQFWADLESKFKIGDIKFIKELIRKNEIKMDDMVVIY